ncbi:unnamed protein product [Symbiodinium sp. CCMP2592]|nr:unnamed protein product [Symbiodinium sp. CCMP2592]
MQPADTKFTAKLLALDAEGCRLRRLTPEQVVARRKLAREFRCGPEVKLEVTSRMQTVELTTCDPRFWTEDDEGVQRGLIVICAVVMNSILGRGSWALAGYAVLDVAGKSKAEEAFIEHARKANRWLLEWEGTYRNLGLSAGRVIRRGRRRLLEDIAHVVDAGFSKWARDAFAKIISTSTISFILPVSEAFGNFELTLGDSIRAAPVIIQAGSMLDASLQDLSREVAEMLPEPACSHQMLDSAVSLALQESALPQSRLLMARYTEKSLRADSPSDATWVHEMLDAIGSLTVEESTPPQSRLLMAHFPEKSLLADWSPDATWVHEMLDAIGSLTVQESTLPQSRLLMAHFPEKSLRADWSPDATWVHEMLDAIGSLTVQESTLPQSRLLMAHFPEKSLRADWSRDATWVHEMLDAIGSLTVQESTLPQSRLLMAHFPEKSLRADWSPDATWVHEMLDAIGSLTVQESTLPQARLLMAHFPEKSLRADWPSDATWVHEMLDATGSLSVQESTLPQSRLLSLPCSENMLQAHWLPVVNWVHEMLDSASSVTVKESSLTGLRPLAAQYAEDFLQVACPSDASWVHEMVDAKGSFTAVESKLPGFRRLEARHVELLAPDSYLWVVAETGRADFGQATDEALLNNMATGRAFTRKGVILKGDEEVFVERVRIWTALERRGLAAQKGGFLTVAAKASLCSANLKSPLTSETFVELD